MAWTGPRHGGSKGGSGGSGGDLARVGAYEWERRLGFHQLLYHDSAIRVIGWLIDNHRCLGQLG